MADKKRRYVNMEKMVEETCQKIVKRYKYYSAKVEPFDNRLSWATSAEEYCYIVITHKVYNVQVKEDFCMSPLIYTPTNPKKWLRKECKNIIKQIRKKILKEINAIQKIALKTKYGKEYKKHIK